MSRSQNGKMRLEDYRQGYPRLAAFMNLERNFSILKRFDYLHMRSLLDLQDQLGELEDRLNELDDTERVQLRLSSRRQDDSKDRRELLQQIRVVIKQYDVAVKGYSDLLGLPEANQRQRLSVNNWFNGNKPLVKSESRNFLDICTGDYLSFAADEKEKAGLESVLEFGVKAFPTMAKRFSVSQSKTLDEHILLFPPKLLNRIIKVFVAIFLPVWIIAPAILLYNATDHSTRATIYAIFTFWTSFVVVATANTTKYDLILALVTYATLLGAFLASEQPS
ncbi:hypothetical protein F4819DRAFT_305951 [Hypoxylon fuscum]|nr:hypothetical protein F4819DRAFT_305951 [Hypoxylon fuscum]